MRRRLDAELVRRGLVSSRARAVEMIGAGRVTVGGAPATTPARQVAPEEAVVVAGAPARFVSRGGEKLDAALEHWSIDVQGRRILDAGASTGGFTDCLLQRGAAHVVALDVGHSQLAWSLRSDDRVEVLERTNLRLVTELDGGPVELAVADLSFISLSTVAPALDRVTTPDAQLVVLVKPQFEAGRARLGRGGIVRDPAVHRAVLGEVTAGLAHAGLVVRDVIRSPLHGADGNIEFLAWVGKTGTAVAPATLDQVCEDE
ncbi:MAG: TlyA family RNA methyltransferase [Acidimicrobiia bacterium]|nr:TlyA family RNA methyltransferase [Acidimicrobiia bacterium]